MSQSSFITEFNRNSKKSEMIKNNERKSCSYQDFWSDNPQGRKVNDPARIVEVKRNIQMYGMQAMNNLYELSNQMASIDQQIVGIQEKLKSKRQQYKRLIEEQNNVSRSKEISERELAEI